MKKREFRNHEFIFRQISRFILGQPTTLEMGYSRGSKYGHGRGRSYGGGASRDFNRGSPTPKPVEAGKEYEVNITEISRQGDGVARIQGFVVFVQNGKVGNNIKIKITEVGDRFAKATISV
jgi:predicted RNA-binding protein with TRAM domain